uniref:GTPase IMAP family member 7-like n=1 Tax=Acanthochromis polyacanthus TaxID=80966 RepID=A0A3Q1GD24_9TELE
MATEMSSLCEQEEYRIMLIGKVGSAKKWAIETILNSSEECEEPSETKINLDPKECQCFRVKIEGRDVVVFDTPGLCHTERSDEETMKEIKTCISRDKSGLHGFLVVLDLEPFTQEEKDMVQMIDSSLGKSVKDYMMPLFVRGNELKERGKTIQQFISDNTDLKEFADGCRGKPCVIDHRNQDPTQVENLLQQISNMVKDNKAEKRSCYTTNMMQRAESIAENKKKMALSANSGALVGATIGGAASYSVSSWIGIAAGILAGAFVGGLMGIAGIVAYIRAKRH